MNTFTRAVDVPAIQDEYQTDDQLRHALSGNDVNWDVRMGRSPLSVGLVPRQAGDLRLLWSWGDPFVALRGDAQLASDSTEFIGILYQRAGCTLYERDGQQTEVRAGDIALWYSGYKARFTMPERFEKLCMVVPVAEFQEVLPKVVSYDGLRIEAGSHAGALLGSWLTTLAQRVIGSDDEPFKPSIEMTIDVLAVSFASRARQFDAYREKDLLSYVIQYVERRLDDPDLTPAQVAHRFGISIRNLNRLFSQRRTTFGSWRRGRRLAKCRSELEDKRSRRTITEIAIAWGFNDLAHFSRLFKATYGVSPGAFRRGHRESRDERPLL